VKDAPHDGGLVRVDSSAAAIITVLENIIAVALAARMRPAFTRPIWPRRVFCARSLRNSENKGCAGERGRGGEIVFWVDADLSRHGELGLIGSREPHCTCNCGEKGKWKKRLGSNVMSVMLLSRRNVLF
jgi:hypothetical protein